MEIFNTIWSYIVAAVGGVSAVGILTSIVYCSLKAAFNKTISKINVEKISNEATDKGIERIKNISFKQSIQPIAESELRKITERANEYIDKALAGVQEKYDNLILIIEKLAEYFDNSIGVPDYKKEELHNAVDNAKNNAHDTQEITVVELVSETEKSATEEKNGHTEKTSVVR